MQDDHNTPEEQGLEQKIKKAMMATLGTVAGAVERAADAVSSAVTKENIDRMAEKGEQAFQQAREFGASAFKQVKEMSMDAYDKVKDSFSGDEGEELHHTIDRAAEGLNDAMDKMRDAAARVVSRENMEQKGGDLLREIGEQKEKMTSLVQKLKDIAREESEMAKQEMQEILDMEDEAEQKDDGASGDEPKDGQ